MNIKSSKNICAINEYDGCTTITSCGIYGKHKKQ